MNNYENYKKIKSNEVKNIIIYIGREGVNYEYWDIASEGYNLAQEVYEILIEGINNEGKFINIYNPFSNTRTVINIDSITDFYVEYY